MHTKDTTDLATILTLAGKAVCDPRTAEKALDRERGPQAIRSRAVRERVIAAMNDLGLALDRHDSTPPPTRAA